ncbi:hypothetical protein PF011_g3369 [Phytophthora fragariae]|uniref:PH domain-containing protein n=1 Tax=Phytophthora fragariae TaxID=53985 RepID=A0A6A3M8I4_9STRA|nr:hypothetical protein PF011_g3369 [Phytophthora fragariae]
MLVNGVDISMLEGWMVKINSNLSFFGKNMNRRWFKVGFVPGPGSEKKLVISYSTSKTAKDPRGWLYVEDVSGIYCRREMIEIVSPSRTLRLKGETAVEHRLWSDSLYKLCNPPPKSATAVVQCTPAVAEPRQERAPRRAQRESKQADVNENEDRAQRTQRSERERERERDRRHAEDEDRERGSRSVRSNRHRDDSDREDSGRENRRRDRERSHDRDRSRGRSPRDDHDDRDMRKHRSPSPKQREPRREKLDELESSRRSPEKREEESASSGARQPVSSNHPSEYEHSDDDSSEDDRADSPRPSTNSSTRSMLVAHIKSGSSFEDIAQCKNVISDSEEEDEEYHYENKDEDPEEESPREPVTTSTNALDDENSRDELEQMNPERIPATQPSKRVNSDYFDSDEEDSEQAAPPTKNLAASDDPKAPVSSVSADNNFVHDDWDAEEEEPSSSAPTSKSSYPSAVGSGAVTADANFVHEDWDN